MVNFFIDVYIRSEEEKKKENSATKTQENAKSAGNINDKYEVGTPTTEEGVKYSRRHSTVSWNYQLDFYDMEEIANYLSKLTPVSDTSKVLEALDEKSNASFVDALCAYINDKNIKDADLYKAANIDRRLFSKMMSDKDYTPSKDTAIALGFALKLTLSEFNDLLARAGYILSHSVRRDIIIEYFIRDRIYNLVIINEVLERLDQKPIGR